MIVLFWIINFGISLLNAWGCGKTWNESKAAGGFPHFLNWCGAIMAAAGFSWCFLVITGFLGATIPFEQTIDGEIVNEPYLQGEHFEAFANLAYSVIIFPVLGSGIAITVHSWGVAWRNRTFGNVGVAAWNTYAMGHNIYSAVNTLPGAFNQVGDYFGSSNDDSSDFIKNVIYILVAASVVGGILTTWFIITRTAKATAKERSIKYADAIAAMERAR